ncbi:molybdenum cofactor guanylyltransferase [Komagataeibacter rhaeticus]|uniref:Molybdenum cofactor guanylyltransferase n=1 Tax=Komagataeibacter rhaeticus TaxID=215221 RepID=A0A181C5B4_9PROT|nr:NTP transferase domain-containing protein [Komagataeibacter rhaeticus]KDU94511.1 molybdenum cofactor biosynthesis protein [Komagataeibacter rhaeticus AF1]MBL7240018.1 NTP transferase domain-containing protein [Komagataeibacter rhaeticus]PYD52540.1 molybdenum cofactor guanylyltransferase [Komagataeibacter rhaeticus]QIP36702.1 NTP transferase domain-containing protein [Komagataeibacter rhaeticus]QOC46465.1 NTP transferase domain-containing protein [Komagataeibacter rhaeticus]
MTALLYGLVLAGGASRRMGQDKAALPYGGRPQLARAFDLLGRHVRRCFVSIRPDQGHDPLRASYPCIVDRKGMGEKLDGGPMLGVLSAHAAYPDVAWLVVACDLPMLDDRTLATLVDERNADMDATAYLSEGDGLPEPLCTIWEPAMLASLQEHAACRKIRLRQMLASSPVRFLAPPGTGALENVNSPDERDRVLRRLARYGQEAGC